MFGRPLVPEELALAKLLVQVAAGWIREAIDEAGKDALSADDPRAQLVTYMMVREALAVPMELVGHTSYQEASDDRSHGGTFAAAADLMEFTEGHRRMLGLSATAQPEACFDGYPEPLQGITYRPTPGGVTVLGQVAIGESWT
jgi:hypothetical protein